MKEADKKSEEKQAVFLFWIHLALLLSTFGLTIKALDDGSVLKKICLSTGLILFLSLTVLLFLRMRRIQKSQ
ncbi:hypothetical protein EOD41_16890 [Mucilaginibacter limnophilus]|uniref:Uncharacterized protein n=1 Tax=Mucilaginibacter limnophilus TaxID=1932778 RepID=A0A3S2UJL8_9SPHI|nr:hypothetical protein [Mucilaginibacter limnophilus]RVT98465.1 hypothetical protein EOD41_16890 [Mucilaginibacter limnophilus]